MKRSLSLVLAAGGVHLACLGAHAQQFHAGLPHFPIGNAGLDPGANGLRVAFGPNGGGVHIDVGRSDYHVVELGGVVAGQLPTGAFLEVVGNSTLQRPDPEPAVRLRLIDMGPFLAVSLDDTSLAPTALRIEMRAGGNTVGQTTINGAILEPNRLRINPTVRFRVDPVWTMWPPTRPPIRRCPPFCPDPPPDVEVWTMLVSDTPFQAQLDNGQIMMIDQLIIAAERVQPEPDPYLDVTVRSMNITGGGGMQFFDVFTEALGMFHFGNRALGGAHMEGVEHNLRLTNLGSTGQDGVVIDLNARPSPVPALVSWLPLNPSGVPLPNGAALDISATGSVGTVGDALLGVLHVEDVGGRIEMSPDFRAIGGTRSRLEIYRDGELQAAFDGLEGAGRPVAAVPETMWPGGCGKIVPGEIIPCYIVHWPGDVPILPIGPRGTPVIGDEVRILASNAQARIDSLNTLGIRTSLIKDLTITDERFGRPCACDWNGSGTLNSQDFFDFLQDFFGGGADFNGDGFTNSQDFFDFLVCFFSGCR